MSATVIDPLVDLASACAAAGSQRAWARKHGLTAQYVQDVLHGRRPPGPAILTALGLRRVERIERVEPTAPPADATSRSPAASE